MLKVLIIPDEITSTMAFRSSPVKRSSTCRDYAHGPVIDFFFQV